jgi:hypothetical protein
MLARNALSLSKGVLFGILWYRLGGDPVPTVDPPGEILKFAALAAEGNPGCFGWLATAKDTHASGHGDILLAGR